jgi:hypothetical protein
MAVKLADMDRSAMSSLSVAVIVCCRHCPLPSVFIVVTIRCSRHPLPLSFIIVAIHHCHRPSLSSSVVVVVAVHHRCNRCPLPSLSITIWFRPFGFVRIVLSIRFRLFDAIHRCSSLSTHRILQIISSALYCYKILGHGTTPCLRMMKALPLN